MRGGWKLGFVIPALMCLVVALDLGLRFMPLELVAFRTWEPALRRELPAWGGFEPGKVVVKTDAYGDLASMGNLPSFRQYRREEFRVDRFGFRNSHLSDAAMYKGVVVGDSYVVAHDEPWELTLPGQLSRLAGARFYNAGAPSTISPEIVCALASELKISSGVVVYLLLERIARWGPPKMIERPAPDELPDQRTGHPQAASAVARVQFPEVSQWIWPVQPTPGRIISQKLFKRVQNDVLLPNPYAKAVIRRKLQNGDEMLFIPWDLDPLGDVNALSSNWQTYLSWFAGKLAKRNLSMVVLLVPNKYTVYGPLVAGSSGAANGDRLLVGIEDGLRRAGMPVVNLTATFRQAAADGLPRRDYLYWQDDTHWNARGIGIAADQLWEQIPSKYVASRNTPYPPDL